MTRMEPFRTRRAANLSGGMKQKLALMCTLLHHPQILFLDEPTNGVDPVSRRDFWAILYQLVRDGLTVFVTTAYLDEAERCNRVGLMNQGRMIRCDSPQSAETHTSRKICYEIETSDQRAARALLPHNPAYLRWSPTAPNCTCSSRSANAPDALDKRCRNGNPVASFRAIVPSLEDVFIGLVRKSEHAA